MLFLSVRRFSDYAGFELATRVYRSQPCCLPRYRHRVGILFRDFSKLNSPAHWYPYLRFNEHLAMLAARLGAKMDSLSPFL